MSTITRRTLWLPAALVALVGMLAAGPTAAATTGTICGEVTAFTAPTAVADGSITIDGTVEVIDSSAFGAVDAATFTTLAAVAAADATTCLSITADSAGAITDVEIAASVEVCGDVALDTTTGVYSVDGVLLPLGLVGADADLLAVLDAAVDGGAEACATLTVDTTSGLIVGASVDATIDACGTVALDVDSATIGTLDVPLTLLDAEAIAALSAVVDAGGQACVELVASDSSLVEANVSASLDLCGEVTLDADGNAVVDGSTIDADLLSAGAAALLELAAVADGTACASVDATSSGGDTVVGVSVTIEVCAEVTAISDGTITLEGIELIWTAAGESTVEVGDVVCVAAATSPTGDAAISDPDTTAPGTEGGGGDDGPMLPDTATSHPGSGAGGFAAAIALLVVALLTGIHALRSKPMA